MMKRLFLASVVLSAVAAAFLACGDDDNAAPGGGTDAGNDVAQGTDGSSGGVDANKPPTDSGSDAGEWKYEVKVVANFDVAKKELPDGITIMPGAAGEYGTPVVGLNNTGKIAMVFEDGGYNVISPFAAWNPAARLLDVEYNAGDGLTAPVVSFAPQQDAAAPPVGIYKIPTDGTPATQATTFLDPNIGLPNTMKKIGNFYYIADSNGWITKLDLATGTTSKWATGAEFKGNTQACPGAPLSTPRPFGADATATDGTNLYVTNFDHGALVKVPINADGTPGTPVVIYQGLLNGGTDCSLQSLDGVAVDKDGSFYIGNSLKNTLYHLSADGKDLKLLIQGKPPFDQISNMVIESIPGKKKRLLISNFAQGAFVADAGPTPQLLQVDLPPDP